MCQQRIRSGGFRSGWVAGVLVVAACGSRNPCLDDLDWKMEATDDPTPLTDDRGQPLLSLRIDNMCQAPIPLAHFDILLSPGSYATSSPAPSQLLTIQLVDDPDGDGELSRGDLLALAESYATNVVAGHYELRLRPDVEQVGQSTLEVDLQ